MDDHFEPLADNASLHPYEGQVHFLMALVDVLLLFHRISFFSCRKRISFFTSRVTGSCSIQPIFPG
jgi:hypothetical protein